MNGCSIEDNIIECLLDRLKIVSENVTTWVDNDGYLNIRATELNREDLYDWRYDVSNKDDVINMIREISEELIISIRINGEEENIVERTEYMNGRHTLTETRISQSDINNKIHIMIKPKDGCVNFYKYI